MGSLLTHTPFKILEIFQPILPPYPAGRIFYPHTDSYVLAPKRKKPVDFVLPCCDIAEMEHKHCFGDGENQAPHMAPTEDFSSDSRREDGLCVYCLACAATRQRAWKHVNPEKVKAAKKKYREGKKTQAPEWDSSIQGTGPFGDRDNW